MAKAKKETSFGRLIVANPDRPDEKPITLNFGDSMAQWRAAQVFKREGYTISDDFFGYSLFDQEAPAIASAKAFLGDRSAG